MFFNFEEFWEECKADKRTDFDAMTIENCCRSAWNEGVLREKIRTHDIIDFLKKEVMHKSSYKNVLKRENRELKLKLESLKKQKRRAQEILWHDANELPPKEKRWNSINVLTDTEEIAYYNYDENEWIRDSSSEVIDTPSAWCELPKYKER